ncbi:phospholipase A2 [Teleopsis dalmanni]|uniref:phospholipase A2 n=1 Tax=Teleopsis dalmanni TaxID=139649 RepID=UPI0018CE3C98|nr:phospholipase A2 [Teleopsis dalmanni]
MNSLFVTIFNTALLAAVDGFSEESIFDDEDIFNQALPPIAHTGITAPGTKWCGPGNTAENYNDLGTQWEADKCCRAHDHCDDILEAKTSLHGLDNNDWFPILKCTCEQEFLNCLQNVNNMASNTLGRVYFGSRSKCFALGYPLVSCKQYQEGTFRKRCARYDIDKTKKQQWQFYDIPFYSLSRAQPKLNNNEQ